jgi:hypothetical protein
MLSEADHRLNHVATWARQPVHPLDMGDDRLAGVWEALNEDTRWAAFEGASNRQLLRVYDLQQRISAWTEPRPVAMAPSPRTGCSREAIAGRSLPRGLSNGTTDRRPSRRTHRLDGMAVGHPLAPTGPSRGAGPACPPGQGVSGRRSPQ